MSRMCLERACQDSCWKQNGHVFLACPAAEAAPGPGGGWAAGGPGWPAAAAAALTCMPGGGGGAGKDCSMDWMWDWPAGE